MADNIQHYIESGVLEAHVLGSLPDNEEQELIKMKQQYPAVNRALAELEEDMEVVAMQMAIPPPPALWARIEDEINALVETREAEVVPFRPRKKNTDRKDKPEQQYIEVEAQSEYIKVHRLWRWAFAAVFVLGKIFLATAIYFYIENRHNQKEVNELKARVNQLEQLRR
jgi:hypothetical protein